MRSFCTGVTRAYTATWATRASSWDSLARSSSRPVNTRGVEVACPWCAGTSPASRAIASAVAAESPVIITTRTPASRQTRSAAGTSSRSGSWKASTPCTV